MEVLELNVQPDHIHIVLSIPPKYGVSSLMGYLGECLPMVKGNLSTRLFHKYDQFGKKFWGRHLWLRGYCVSTVGLDEEKIRKYVRWQEAKEKEIETQQLKPFK